MNTQQLRQKVLDLAIHGKLVAQDPNEEPASALLERIKAEKERLVKEKKIKKSKANTEPIDAPFEIPEGWEWCILTDLAYFSGGKTPSMANKEYWEGGNNLWVTSKDMKSDVISDSLLKITDKALEVMEVFSEGTILTVVRSGILRRTLPLAILEKTATINQDLKAISLIDKSLSKYIFTYIKGRESYILNEYHKDGTTVDSIDFEKYQNLEVALPPLEEQKRIVAEIEKWMHLIDIIEENQNGLNDNIEKAKAKILDLAVHGKLVAKEGEWREKRFDEIGKIISGGTPSTSNPAYWDNGTIAWISPADLSDYNEKYISHGRKDITKEGLKNSSATLMPANSVLMSSRAPIGYVVISKNEISTNQGFKSIIPNPDVFPEYLYYFCKSNIQDFYQRASGTTFKELSKQKFADTIIPLPPIEEQKRIVAKIEQLFAALDKMKQML